MAERSLSGAQLSLTRLMQDALRCQFPTRFGYRPIFLSAHTRTTASGKEMPWSGSDCAFFMGSSFIPRNSRFAQPAARTSGEFSPIPAVNTKASIPPNLATMEPMQDLSRCTKMSNASFAPGRRPPLPANVCEIQCQTRPLVAPHPMSARSFRCLPVRHDCGAERKSNDAA
jgi:hypothetical protein